MEESRKDYGWLVRGRNAAAGCLPMWTGTMGEECYCGNLLWQSSLTLLFPGGRARGAAEAGNHRLPHVRPRLHGRSVAMFVEAAFRVIVV